MSLLIELGSATANHRTIHFRLFTSNGTAPDTGASGDSVIVARGSTTTFTPDVLVTAVHAAQGMYSVQLTQSNVSNLGQHAVYHTQGDFPQHVANFCVVNYNPYSTQSNVDSNVSLWRGVAPNALIAGRVDVDASAVSVGLKAQVHSQATIAGASFVTINPGTYSNVTFSAGGTAPSLVTLAPGTHSSATIQGVTRAVNLTTNDDKTGYTILAGTYSAVTFSAGGTAPSLVTLAPGTHSSATVQGVTRTVNLTTNDDKTGYTILAGTYSNVTFSAGGLAPSLVTIAPTSTVTVSVNQDKTNYTIAAGTYSNVTFSAGGLAPSLVTIAPTSTVTVAVNQDKTGYGLAAGTYSGATVGIDNIAAGNYSGVTISGVTASNVLDKTGYGLAAGDYSGATVGINNIAAGTYSGVTVGSAATILAGGIIAASFGASAIDAAALATDAGQEIADRLLARRISGGADSGRTVAEALYVLRNRVEIGDSVGTIYQVDDTTSAWTMSVTTAAFPLGQVNPA